MTDLRTIFQNQSQSGSMFSYINDQTGFAIGERFDNETDVRNYFGVVQGLFDFTDENEPITPEILKEMEDMVIDNGWWMYSEDEPPMEKD